VSGRPAIAGDQVENSGDRRGETADHHIVVEEDRRDLSRLEHIAQIGIGAIDLIHFRVQFRIDGLQLFIDRLQFLLGGLQLLVGGLQLLVHGLQFFVRRFQFLDRRLVFLDGGLQALARVAKLLLQVLRGPVATIVIRPRQIGHRQPDILKQHEEQRVAMIVAKRLDQDIDQLHPVIDLDRNLLAPDRTPGVHGFPQGVTQIET
jgi:hypothetical protein